MFAIRQIIDDPQEMIPVPVELRHRRTEVIFIDMERSDSEQAKIKTKPTLASLAGCWLGDAIERAPQGNYETRREFE